MMLMGPGKLLDLGALAEEAGSDGNCSGRPWPVWEKMEVARAILATRGAQTWCVGVVDDGKAKGSLKFRDPWLHVMNFPGIRMAWKCSKNQFRLGGLLAWVLCTQGRRIRAPRADATWRHALHACSPAGPPGKHLGGAHYAKTSTDRWGPHVSGSYVWCQKE